MIHNESWMQVTDLNTASDEVLREFIADQCNVGYDGFGPRIVPLRDLYVVGDITRQSSHRFTKLYNEFIASR